MKYGDKVKDINPQCAHYGAEGKVVGTKPNKVIFIVTNKGKTYKPGDKLEKTNEQMKKTSSLTISEAAQKELEKVGMMGAIGRGMKAVGTKMKSGAQAVGRGAKKTVKVTAGAGAVGTAGYVAGKSKAKEEEKKRSMPYPQNRYFG
jgi:hypothetical protein